MPQTKLAQAAYISESTLQRRLRNPGEFTLDEIRRVGACPELSADELRDLCLVRR